MVKELWKIKTEDKDILENYRLSFPVKLGALAHELGVSRVMVSSMDTGKSGQIKKENGEYVIKVNRNDGRERQRFTIAHELAHFLIHRDEIDRSRDGITDTVLYRSNASALIEREANRLAAYIIMPVKLIKREFDEKFEGINSEEAVESLATRFQVSKAAMRIRLSALSEK